MWGLMVDNFLPVLQNKIASLKANLFKPNNNLKTTYCYKLQIKKKKLNG